jgi:hypothetical protein
MPQYFQEGRVSFDFPDGWRVLRPQEASYYRRHFQSFAGGAKECDFLLFEPHHRILWMVEVKDYTTQPRSKTTDLMREVAQKVRDSLALLVSAAANDTTDPAKAGAFARAVLPPAGLRVVLHLDQPSKPSKLFPRQKMETDATQRLRQEVRGVDARARVVSTTRPGSVPWSSRWHPDEPPAKRPRHLKKAGAS